MAQLTLPVESTVIDETRLHPAEWAAHERPAGRPQIVVGGPGTGKTEFLSRRIAGALASGVAPDRILVLGFSRRGIDDMRRRVEGIAGQDAHRITFATYHSLAMRIVETRWRDLGWSQPPTILTSAEQEHLVAGLLETEDPSAWPAPWRSLLTSEVMASEVTNFLLRAADQALSPEDIAGFGRDQWRAVAAFAERYEEALASEHRIDHGRALRDAGAILASGDPLAHAYDVVVADEYQDTTPAQARMLLSFLSGTNDLVVAADPYQSIYSFRGTDINNVYAYPDAVSDVSGTRAERLILTTSMRVPGEILDAAVAVTARELPGGAGKVLSDRHGGAVACHVFDTRGDESEWIAGDIERLHLTEGIPLERIAVFVRRHSEFVDDLVRALERRDLPHSQSEDRLVDEPAIRVLRDIVNAARGGEEAEGALRRVLLGPFFALPPGLVSRLPDEPSEWPAWLESIDDSMAPIADLMRSDEWWSSESAPAGLWHVWTTLPQLHDVAIDPDGHRDRAAWSAYAQVLDRFSERSPGATLGDHVDLVSALDYEADALLTVGDAEGVTVATLHQAKGTEFDAVYIADAIEGTLPDLRSSDSLLGARHLNPHLPTVTADYVTFRLDEERRLAYTAMTRSTSRVVWTATVPTDEGEGARPSRFMELVAPPTPPSRTDEPLTPRAYLARLRRIASDPQASLVDRLAAIRVLSNPDTVGGDPLDRYGTRSPGPDHGIVARDLRMSPSKAHAYEQCPRRFAFEQFLMSPAAESVHMRLGAVVHDVLERVEASAVADDRRHASLDEALEVLDERWPEAGFEDDSVGRAWKQRAATLLGNLYDGWPSTAVPVELEFELPLSLGDTEWLGRADRIEASDADLRIVDYKTGGTSTRTDAAASIQLGYYLLAARESESLAALGDFVEAEFWYPKSPNKHTIATRSFDIGNLDDVRARLIDIAASIDGERFPPVPGDACRTCPVASSCPAQPDGVGAFT